MRALEQLNAPPALAPPAIAPPTAKEIGVAARELYARRYAAHSDLLRSLDTFTNDEIRGLARLCRDFPDTMRKGVLGPSVKLTKPRRARKP